MTGPTTTEHSTLVEHSTLLSPRRLVTIVALVGAWCALWGSISVANVASGLAVAALVSHPWIGTAGIGSIRLVPLLRLIGIVVADLVASTATVAWEILTPTDHTQESIVAIQVPDGARSHMLLLVIAITVTPGTAVMDADAETGTLYLHLLHGERRDATLEHVARLAALVENALPQPSLPPTSRSEVRP